MPTPKRLQTFFPLVLDNTIISNWSSCPTKCFRNYIQHLSYGRESIHLVFGKAFALGLEVTRKAYYEGGLDTHEAILNGQEVALEEFGDTIPPERSNKTADRLWGALESYFMEWPLKDDHAKPVAMADGSFGIEYSFIHQLDIMHPTLGIPLMYAGRADMLTEYQGRLWVEDDKTTSMFTKHWAKSWDTRGQFTGYCWGIRKNDLPVVGALIRGIAIQKTQYKFAETTTMRSEWEINNWYNDTMWRITDMVKAYTDYINNPKAHSSEFFPADRGDACNAYMTPCAFMDQCKNPKTEVFLTSEMEQHIWLPHEQRRENLDVFLQTLRDDDLL